MEMQCQSCHGTMSTVGGHAHGLAIEPNCQAATPATGQQQRPDRFIAAFDSPGHLRVPANNPSPPPRTLRRRAFRFIAFPWVTAACNAPPATARPTRNFPPRSQRQPAKHRAPGPRRHAGGVHSCHVTTPITVTGGPHGMHPMDQSWVSSHGDLRRAKATHCQMCHGADSAAPCSPALRADRSFSLEEGGTKRFWRDQKIGCYDCHNGPGGEGSSEDATSRPDECQRLS